MNNESSLYGEGTKIVLGGMTLVGLLVVWGMFIAQNGEVGFFEEKTTPESCFEVETITNKVAQNKCELHQNRLEDEQKKLTPERYCDGEYCMMIPPVYDKPLYHHTFDDMVSNYYCSQRRDAVIITDYSRDEEQCGVNVVIPRTIEGKQVVAIGKHAFWLDYDKRRNPNYLKLEQVVLPKGLVWIDDEAFASNNLSGELILPRSLKAIGERGFGNNNLESVRFNQWLEVIESKAFRNNKLSHIDLPESVAYIQSEAFLKNQIESVHLPVNLNEGTKVNPVTIFDRGVEIE